MSSRRKPGKHLPKIREFVIAARDKGMGTVCVEEVVKKLGVEPKLVSQCFTILNREGLLGQRDNSGMCHDGWYPKFYPIIRPQERRIHCLRCRDRGEVYSNEALRATGEGWEACPRCTTSVPRKRKVTWGSKRKALSFVRKDRPWVVELWYPDEKRWYLYMEVPLRPETGWKGVPGFLGVPPEHQRDLTRSQLRVNHYEIDAALKKCRELRRLHPKRDFRTRDTSKGDYIMGAILL